MKATVYCCKRKLRKETCTWLQVLNWKWKGRPFLPTPGLFLASLSLTIFGGRKIQMIEVSVWTLGISLYQAKIQGGMGFCNYRAFNEAMLARQGWSLFMNPQAIWGRFLKGIYFPNSSFLQASRGSHASWAWMSLLHGRNLLVKGPRWQIQNGKTTDLWGDPRVPSLPNF